MIPGNLKAERLRLGLAYELWVWLPLTGILMFSLAYLAVAYCKKHQKLCYKQNNSSAPEQHAVEVRNSIIILYI